MTAAGEAGRPAVKEAEVKAAMRAFERFSSVLRYREVEKWHANDIAGMRAALEAAAAARPVPAAEGPEVERLRATLRAADAAIADLCVTAGIIARGNDRGIADFDRRAAALRKALAEAADPASHDRSAK